jgi:hypothetical protein
MLSKRMRKAIPVIAKKYPLFQTAASVQELIVFVLKTWRNTAPRKKPNDDQRDIMNWSDNLAGLSTSDLHMLIESGRSEARRRFRYGHYPTQKLRKQNREFVTTLPGRVIIKVAKYRLDVLEGRG